MTRSTSNHFIHPITTRHFFKVKLNQIKTWPSSNLGIIYIKSWHYYHQIMTQHFFKVKHNRRRPRNHSISRAIRFPSKILKSFLHFPTDVEAAASRTRKIRFLGRTFFRDIFWLSPKDSSCSDSCWCGSPPCWTSSFCRSPSRSGKIWEPSPRPFPSFCPINIY